MTGIRRGVPVPGLRSWREARLLTQEELAERAGVGLSTVKNGELGQNIQFRNVRKLAVALGVQPELLTRDQSGRDTPPGKLQGAA